MVTLKHAPTDVVGDNLCKLKGLIGTLSALAAGAEDMMIEDEDLSWTFIVLDGLVTEIQTDLKALEENDDEPEEPQAMAEPEVQVPTKIPRTKKGV